MKILIAISHSFCSNFIKGQASFLKRKGHEVIIVSAPGPEVRKVANDEGAKLVELPISREINFFGDLKALLEIRRLINKEKPDIINAGNPKTGFLFALQKLLLVKTPIIFTLRGLRSDTLTGFKRTIVSFTEKISCSLPNKIIVISPSLRNHARERKILANNKGLVILKGSSNGINLNRFNPDLIKQNEVSELRNSWGCNPETVVIGFIGRITKDKGVRELYDAFLLIRKDKQFVKLVLTGPLEEDDVIDSEILEKMQKDVDVLFLGSQQNIPTILTAYDILVLYSYREGFGNVALEASAMKCPVIVSDIPGARDTIVNNETGFLVPPKSPVLLKDSLSNLIENPKLRKAMGVSGRNRVLTYFDSIKIWQEQLNIYQELHES